MPIVKSSWSRWQESYILRHLNGISFRGLCLASIPFYVFLLYIYRAGSPKVDAGNPNPGPRDVGVYINAALDVFSGANPYQNSAARFGTFGTLPFIALAPLSTPQVVAVTQILGLIGFQFLIFTLGRIYSLPVNWLIPIIPLFASSRENLVTAQVTGILCGLAGISFMLLLKPKHLTNTFLSTLLAALVIDLKPHLMIFFVAVVLIQIKQSHVFLYSLLIIFFMHTMINILHGEFLEVSWFRTLNSIEESASFGNFTDSHTFWPIVAVFYNNTSSISIISMLLVIVIGFFSLLFAKSHKSPYVCMAALFVPAFSIYFHLYDLVLINSLILAIISKSSLRVQGFLLSFFVSQSLQGTNVNSGLSFSIFFFSWLIFNMISAKNFTNWKTRYSLSGLLLSVTLNYMVSFFVPENLVHSVRISLILSYILLSLIYLSFRTSSDYKVAFTHDHFRQSPKNVVKE